MDMSKRKSVPVYSRRTAGTDAMIVAACLFLGVAEIGLMTRLEASHPGSDPAETEVPVDETVEVVEVPPAAETEVTDALPATGLQRPAFITLFGSGTDPRVWYRSQFDNPDSFLNVDWREANISASAEGISLAIERNDEPGNPYTSAELQSQEFFGYGRYEVVMRPARGSGLVTSFFTYTGPHYDQPHDEVDIEFLGSNTRQVHFNYFRDGKVGASETFDLPFDAADTAHLYAFEWRPDGISWFVDGALFHQTEAGDALIPQTPGKIIMNLWTGKDRFQQWHGPATFAAGTKADYACVSYRPLGSRARSCSTIFLPKSEPARLLGVAVNAGIVQAIHATRSHGMPVTD